MIDKNKTISAGSIVAVIDMGSNSFHMVISQYGTHSCRVIERFMRNVRLAENFSHNKVLSQSSIKRGLECIHEFSQYLKDSPPDALWAVATNTLRNAVNKDDFIKDAEKILGHPIDVISGNEEARLIYLGSISTQFNNGSNRLVVDIGGGSTEYIVGQNLGTKILKSLQLGCVVFSDRYFHDGNLSDSGFQSAYYAARIALATIEKEIADVGWDQAFGSSGTIRAIYNLIKIPGKRNYIHYTDLVDLKLRILKYSNINDINIAKLPQKKRNTFPAGLAILLATFDALNISNMQFSEGALREGMLYEMSTFNKQDKPSEKAIQELEINYKVNLAYSSTLLYNLQYCFSESQDEWNLTSQHLYLVEIAARLCKIGMYISYINYQHHSVYIINNANLLGFSTKQKKHLALLVRNHTQSVSKSILANIANTEELQQLSYLILLIRIAHILTTARTKEKSIDYKFQVKKNIMTIICSKSWVANNPVNYVKLTEETQILKKTPYKLMIEILQD